MTSSLIELRIEEKLREGKRADAIDILLDNLDGLLLAHCYSVVNDVLKRLSEKAWPISLLLAALVITRPYRIGLLTEGREMLTAHIRDLALKDRSLLETERLLEGLL